MFINKEILEELQELDELRARCENAIKANGTYSHDIISGLVVYIDEGFDKTPLATKLNTLKHKTACAKLELVNARIKFLTKLLR